MNFTGKVYAVNIESPTRISPIQRRIPTRVGTLAVADHGSGTPVVLWPSLFSDHRLFALVVVFQPELRRALERIGRFGSLGWLLAPSSAAVERVAVVHLAGLAREAVPDGFAFSIFF